MMKKAIFVGAGILIGYYLANRNKTNTVTNTELVVKMITRGATVEELASVGSLIKKYCPEI